MSSRNVLSQFYTLYSFLPTIYIKLRSMNTVFNNLVENVSYPFPLPLNCGAQMFIIFV